MSVLLSSAYFGPVEYFNQFLQNENIEIEQHENFIKQTYRNRCVILGPNGAQNLNIPIEKKSGKQNIKDVKIAYAENWADPHWRSPQTAYGSSPFFELIAPDVKKLLESKPTFLLDLNLKSTTLALEWLNLETPFTLTRSFAPVNNQHDLRFNISPKVKSTAGFPPYFQVFGKEFTNNLSVLDLLFNQGKEAATFLG